ncbi:hypothetical protein ID866_3746 [Astraeus odoratus]|nr:hypothetical protein ID866_3746 [Astraeus odoratus]
MHPCLLVHELLLHIIGFLAEDATLRTPCPSGNRDIARFARTCKSFMDPALDVLWHTQCALSPLVMCLPYDVWSRRVFDKIHFIREPSTDDWVKLQRYSHRIHVFSGPKIPGLSGVDDGILKTIFAPQLFHELFPSVHHLDFNIFSTASVTFPLLPGVLSSRLVRLSFTVPQWCHPDAFLDVVDSIHERASSLQVLNINSFASSPGLEVRLSEDQVPQLSTLSLSVRLRITPDSLCCLVQLQNLRVLSIKLPDNYVIAYRPLRPSFPALRRIKVTAPSLDMCSALLSSITSSKLEEIAISYDAQAPCTSLRAFFQEVQHIHDRSCGFHTLKLQHNLQLTSSIDPPFVILAPTLAPLLACSRLRVLCLINLGSFDINDQFVGQAALAWSAIEELRLRSLPWTTSHSTSFASFRELVEHCPRLRRLYMAFDARIVPDGGLGNAESAPQTLSFSMFNVYNSQIADARAVARYLRTVVPRLKILMAETSDTTAREMWRDTQSLLKIAPLQLSS